MHYLKLHGSKFVIIMDAKNLIMNQKLAQAMKGELYKTKVSYCKQKFMNFDSRYTFELNIFKRTRIVKII